jgi:lipase maturation factor 1
VEARVEVNETAVSDPAPSDRAPPYADVPRSPARQSCYVVSTWLFGRALGAVFLIALLSIGSQIQGLVGAHGVVPVTEQLAFYVARLGRAAAWQVPSLLWWNASDAALVGWAWLGGGAAALLTLGVVPRVALITCIATYLSLMNLGGPFTHFQWDSLLIETGFAALFVTPGTWWHSPVQRAGSVLGRLVSVLLLAKLMFLSGWVKLASGDASWADLSALRYHYLTQPLPNSLSVWMHALPSWLQQTSAIVMFGIEFLLPLAALVPHRVPRRVAAFGFITLMVVINATGNYGFFNILVAALCLVLIDDALWWRTFQRPLAVARARFPRLKALVYPGLEPAADPFSRTLGVALAAGGLLCWSLLVGREHTVRLVLLLGVIATAAFCMRRLRRSSQELTLRPKGWAVRRGAVQLLAVYWLIASTSAGAARLLPELGPVVAQEFEDNDGLQIWNSYGLFAVMTTRRQEIVLEGSVESGTWLPYEFRYKPGALRRVPPTVLGHMPRLDWQMWFAALGNAQQNPWLGRLMQRLVSAEPSVLALLGHDPFAGAAPYAVRAVIYDYEFAEPEERKQSGRWWKRSGRRVYASTVH